MPNLQDLQDKIRPKRKTARPKYDQLNSVGFQSETNILNLTTPAVISSGSVSQALLNRSKTITGGDSQNLTARSFLSRSTPLNSPSMDRMEGAGRGFGIDLGVDENGELLDYDEEESPEIRSVSGTGAKSKTFDPSTMAQQIEKMKEHNERMKYELQLRQQHIKMQAELQELALQNKKLAQEIAKTDKIMTGPSSNPSKKAEKPEKSEKNRTAWGNVKPLTQPYLASICSNSGIQQVAQLLNQTKEEGEITTEDEDNEDEDNEDSEGETKTKSKKKKSGFYAKFADNVVNPQVWPHQNLKHQTTAKKVSYDQMSWDQFIAGETRTIIRAKDPNEVLGRINLLNKMAHWKIKTKSWQKVRALYESIITMIEEGEANWGSNFTNIEYLMLGSFTHEDTDTNKPNRQKTRTKVWWCPDYNRDGCDKKYTHKANKKG